MTFSYVSPETNEKDAVRFLLGDTNSEVPMLSDEEINWMISRWKPIYHTTEGAAAAIAMSLASRYVREAQYSADGVSVSLANLGNQFRELAAALRQQHKDLLVGGLPDVGGITPGEQTDPDIQPLDFGTGMHDNPEAGRQSYGNRDYSRGYYDPHEMPGV
jgi:hypothetical protein